MKRRGNLALSILLIGALLAVGFLVPTKNSEVQAVSPYTPFGGRVLEYSPQSDAKCVEKACGAANKPIHEAIKKALGPTINSVCGAASAVCNVIPILGQAVCYAACREAFHSIIEDSVNICSVEEIKVGPPAPAEVGILDIGTIKIIVRTPKIPPVIGKRITILKIEFSLGRLFPGIGAIAPEVYDYGNYQTEGNWVLGDSINLRELCGLGGEKTAKICDNPIFKALLGALTGGLGEFGQEVFDDAFEKALEEGLSEEEANEKAAAAQKQAEEEYINNCPLLNLVRQIGTSK